MKLIPRDSRHGISIFRLALTLTIAALVPLLAYATAPAWWSQRGVLVQNATADDYALVNQGQLKKIAAAAVAEMDAGLPGGAGTTLHNLVQAWASPTAQTNDFAPVNLGQLKKAAKPFYDRLIATAYASSYPWASDPNPPNDFAVANIGQVKKLFSFDFRAVDVTHDTDQNGLPDWWERFYFGSIGNNPNALAPRGDGLTILQAFQQGLNPNDFYDGVLPLLQKTDGDAQTGKTNEVLMQPLRVRITDSGGVAVANAPVTFSGNASGGTVAAFAGGPFSGSFTANADQNGIASARVRLPGTAETVDIAATVTSGSNTQSVTFTATATTPVDQIAPPPYEVRVLPANAPPYVVTFESNSGDLIAGSGTDQPSSEAVSPPRRSFLWNPVSGAYTELGFVPGSNSTEALALNNAGDVVGDATDANGIGQGFLWRNGTIEPLMVPGATSTHPYAINDAGQVVGTTYGANWVRRGFVWNNGVFTLIEVPNSNGTTVEDINAAGQVVGSYYDEDWNSQAFIWQDGVITTISIPGAMSVSQHFLNDSGQVAGVYRGQNYWNYGFFWQNGVATTITLGGFRTSVYGLNATGQVIGSSVPAGNTVDRGFVWQNGQLTQLGSLAEGQSYDYSVAQSINFYGAIVGTSATPQGTSTSVLWKDGRLWKLTDCVPAYLHPDGAYFEINNSGDITGRRLVLHRLPDSDGDGLPDGWETQYGLDPNSSADAAIDTDGDGLTNYQEYQAGTDPTMADTDGDEVPDGWEAAHGYDPRGAADAQLDEDGDGLTTLQEYQNGTEPRGAYTVTDVAASSSAWVFPSALNEAGQVIGTRGDSSGNTRGYFWHDGVVEDVTPPGADSIDLYSFNDLGQTVGRYLDGNNVFHVFLWQSGAATDLPFPPLYSSAVFLRPQINNQGQIIGTSVDTNSRPHGFIWREDAVVEIASPYAWSYGLGLNNPGLVVGAAFDADWTGHGFIWQDGSLSPLPQVPGRGAINDAGVAAIQYHDSITQIQRVATVENGSINPLGTEYVGELVPGRAINAAGHVLVRNGSNPGVWSNGQLAMVGALNGLWVWPQAFNDSDVVVGESTTPSGATHAFVARENHTTDLNYLVPQGSGLEFSSAIAINNNGQILVKAYKDGWNHAVLLTLNNDSDLNGLPDDWEKFYFGHLGVDPTADADGDGITNAQEYANRTNPNDYYNGVTPVLSIVSGNNQQSDAGAFTPLPLVIKVADVAGNAFVNAPVTFIVSDGGGGLAETPQGIPALTQATRTAADGTAAVSYLQPLGANVTSHITASVGSPGSSTTVVFIAVSTESIPGTAPRLWLKADAGITKDGSNRVSSWADQSGANNTATQATGSNQPLWVNNSVNGKPVLRFDGADDEIVAASSAGSDNFTVIAVAKTANSHEIDGESNSGTGGTWGQQYLFGATYPNGAGVSMGTNGISVYEHAGSYMPALAVYQGALGTAYNIVTVKYTARRPQIYLNSALVRTGFESALGTVNAPTEIGRGPYGAFGGDIAEVLIYDRALNDSDRALVENDLNRRYNVVSTPPDAPSNLTASAATSTQVTLSWDLPGPFLAKLERKTGTNGIYAQVGVTTATGVAIYNDSGLSPNTSYYYRVRAFNLFGDSPYSNEFAITTPQAGPSVPSNGIKVWLRGDFGVNKDAADLIAVWADASGNGNDAVQTTAANKPVAVQGALNGRPLVRFDGTDDILALPNFGSTFTEGEVFVVLRSTGTHVDVSTLWTMGDDYIWGPNLYPNSDGGVYETFGTRNRKTTGQSPQALNQYHIYNVSSKTNEFVTRFNGVEFYRTASNTVFFPTAPILGGGISDHHRFGGDIAEMLIYDHVLTQTERDAVTAYCQVKYGMVDSDGDGLVDWKEVEIGTDALNPDTDGDEIPDGWEFNHGLNPLVNDSAADPDGDGFTNLQEYQNNTDPLDFFNGDYNFIISGGNGQVSPAGTWLPEPLAVRVTTSAGAGLANAAVAFSTGHGGSLSVTSGGTPSSSITVQTDSNGYASAYYLQSNVADTANTVSVQTGTVTVKTTTFTMSTADIPTAGLKLWLNAKAGVILDGGTGVTNWMDQSGSGNSAVWNSAYKPVYYDTIAGGQPAIRFIAAPIYWYATSMTGPLSLGTETSIFAATAINGYSGTGRVISNENRIYFGNDGDGNFVTKYWNGADWNNVPSHSLQLPIGTFSILESINSTTESAYVNGILLDTRPNPMAAFTNGYDLGRDLSGDIAEVLVYDRTLNNAERVLVESYLNRRYNIVSVPPAAPVNLTGTVTTATQATLNWSAQPGVLFKIERKTGLAGTYAQIGATTQAGVTSFVDSSFTAGPQYFYRIRATNMAGDSAYSNWVLVSTVPDMDGDGLLDWWEIQYFGNTEVDPAADPDNDGFTNLQEFQLGTDPTSSTSGPTLTAGTHAQFIGQTVPGTMVAGRSYAVSVTMRNSGTTEWTLPGGANPCLLGIPGLSDGDTSSWGRVTIPLTNAVPSGQLTTFNITVTTPLQPGSYHFQWAMLQPGAQWFQQFTPDTVIAIVDPSLAAGVVTVSDPLDDWSLISTRTAGWDIVRDNTASFEGDDSRLVRLGPSLESVTYEFPEIVGVWAAVYYRNGFDLSQLHFLMSTDGASWSPLAVEVSTAVPQANGWSAVTMSQDQSLPAGMNYLKVEVSGANFADLQIGEIQISHTDLSAPMLEGGTVSVAPDAENTINLDASDADGDPLWFTIITPPAHGTITGVGPAFIYTPDAGYHGQDALSVSVSDGLLTSGPVAVNLVVQSPSVIPPSAITVVDELANFDLTSTRSAHWQLDTDNPANFSGDLSRAVRTDVTPESLTYSYPGIAAFSALLYSTEPTPADAVRLYASSDATSWTRLSFAQPPSTPLGSGWSVSSIDATAALPPGTNYVRIELRGGSPTTPEVGRVALSYIGTDTDLNGLADEWEIAHFGAIGVDPNADADGDGLTNLQEFRLGTDPLANNDSDGDGMPDAWELQFGLNPAVNDAAGDLDGDGVDNLAEFLQGRDPTKGTINGASLINLQVFTPLQ
jgi:probable HAF family extracellular repeat protein